MTDLVVYSAVAAVALGPVLWPVIQAILRRRAVRPDISKPIVSAPASDWRQPWVARLMDLQRVLEENKNSAAADTTKRLVTEIIYDGKPAK